MAKDMQSILVTGNGFDLYHGRKTNYTDFVKCVEEAFAAPREARSAFQVKLTELCNVNGFFRHFHFSLADDPTWTYFEGEMDKLLAALIHFQEVVVENQKDPEYDLISYNIIGGLFSYNDLQIFKHFARVFEQIYDDPAGGMFKLRQQYITPEKVLDVRALVAEVRRELSDFTAALELYLVEGVMKGVRQPVESRDVPVGADDATEMQAAEKPVGDMALRTENERKSCNASAIPAREGLSPQIAALHPDYVINFNYTDTAKLYGISDENIFYAKGQAGHEPRNLVLGAPDTSEEHMEWAYLRIYFQKLMRMIGLPKREMLFPMNVFADEELPFRKKTAPCSADGNGENIPVQAAFFGYSFPDEDAELIRELVQTAKKVVVYYTDCEDYARKMIRLLKLFGRETVSKDVYSGKLVFEVVA